jgi:anion-transporting  ArsA/GET3 family ATPase
MAEPLDLAALVERRHVVVCCGSGGVGKTTTAAALGYLAAEHGRRALVMTIDPARRLAQALGLETLAAEPQRIAIGDAKGTLHAMMLDPKRTFDALIDRHAGSAAARDTIHANRYYQHLSSSLAGSREFMAMEKVYEMGRSDDYDLLIVDTPPAQHALEFLDAPTRLLDLFEGTFVNLLMQPYRVAGRIGFEMFRRSSDRLLKMFERLTGYDVLADLSDFFLAFSGMSAGFRARSQRVLEMLHEPDTGFVLICVPEPASLAEVDRFFARLESDGYPVGGVIINRVHHAAGIHDPSSYALTPSDLTLLGGVPDQRVDGVDLTARLLAAYRDQITSAVLDRAAIDATDVAGSGVPYHTVPHFDRDLHSLSDVAAFAASLAPRSDERGDGAEVPVG